MKKILFYILSTVLTLLTGANCQAVELILKNDLSKYEDSKVLEIENAISVEAPDNKITFKINRGEKKSIVKGNVRSFVICRIYPLHKLKYDVMCPRDTKGIHEINLIQIHDNQLPGGCKVVRTGHWSKQSGTNWEVTDAEGWKTLQGERRGTNLR
jgi:hypothetical protein